VKNSETIESQSTVEERDSSNSAHRKTSSSLSGKLWFAFITVFVSGAVIGAVCGVIAIQSTKRCNIPRPEIVKGRIISHISKELHLSPSQKREAEQIISKMSGKISEIRKIEQPKIREIVKSSFSDIEKILNKKQKKKFNEMQQRIGSGRFRNKKGKRCPMNYNGKNRRNSGGHKRMQHNKDQKNPNKRVIE